MTHAVVVPVVDPSVIATMASVGVTLEWPPVRYAYQVALAGGRASR